MEVQTETLELFERLRPRLFGLSYQMLGSVEDAEDLVQEAYLRWHQADPAEMRSPEGWLVAGPGSRSIGCGTPPWTRMAVRWQPWRSSRTANGSWPATWCSIRTS